MSTSSSAEFSRPCPENGNYDVFISFRGIDTRHGFTNNLYRSLLNSGVYTFLDVKLTGQDIDYLFKMVEKSRMAVVIYSEQFASSDWCLRELELILQRRKENKMTMIPIFYKVDVHELKHLTGKTGECFDEHLKTYDEDTVQKWKNTVTKLGKVSGISYKDTHNRYEYDFITDVIAEIKEKLRELEETVENCIIKQNSEDAESNDNIMKLDEITGELLNIKPANLCFIVEPKKESSACVILSNKTDSYVAFKIRTTQWKKYGVNPNQGLLLPRSTHGVILTMHPQIAFPPDMKCSDKFLIHGMKVKSDFCMDNFSDALKEKSRDDIDEFKLKVVYVSSVADNGSDDNVAQLSSLSLTHSKTTTEEEEQVYRIITTAYFQKIEEMNGELLKIKPAELNFIVEPKKPSSTSFILTNSTTNYVAFKVKVVNAKKYFFRPYIALLLPRSTCEVTVTMQAEGVLPTDMKCSDKLLIQSVKANRYLSSTDDLSNYMFKKELENAIEECKLKVVYVAPPQRDKLTQLANKGLVHGSERVNSIDLHLSKPWLLLGLYSGSVTIWNYETRVEEKSIKVADSPVRSAKFVPKKHWIVVGADDGFVRVLNYNTSENLKEFKAHKDYIRCVAVHPTSPYVLTASDDKLVKLWNWENDWACDDTFEGHSHFVMQVAFDPKDSSSFASVSMDGTIKLWSFGSSVTKFTINAHAKGSNCVEYFFGKDDKLYILSGSDDYTTKIWDYESKTLVQTLEGHLRHVMTTLVHPKLPIIITGSTDKSICIWNKNTHGLKLKWTSDLGRVWSIKFIKVLDEFVLGCDNGIVMIRIVNSET